MDDRSKWKMQTIKLLDDNTGKNLDDLGHDDEFLATARIKI